MNFLKWELFSGSPDMFILLLSLCSREFFGRQLSHAQGDSLPYWFQGSFVCFEILDERFSFVSNCGVNKKN